MSVSMRNTVIVSLATVFLATLPVALSATDEERQLEHRRSRPKIIFIMADDLGYGDFGCYGQELIQTPYIDRMAKEGIRFTHCYAGAPVCASSRCTLMTGQHTGHTRVRDNSGRVGGVPDEMSKSSNGTSILPTLLGQSQDLSQRYMYWEKPPGKFQQAARLGNWKALRLDRNQPLQLIDVATDPAESVDVANSHPDWVAKFEDYFSTARSESVHWPDSLLDARREQK